VLPRKQRVGPRILIPTRGAFTMSTRVSLVDFAEATGLAPRALAQEAATLQAAAGLSPSEAPPPSSDRTPPSRRAPEEPAVPDLIAA
jgi:hypothetical protein